MADASGAIEYYKLAAAVIPVLWVGQALVQLDPAPARQAIEPLDRRLQTLEDQAETVNSEIDRSHSATAEIFEALSPPPGMSGEEQLKRLEELRQREEARGAAIRAAFARGEQKPIDALRGEAASLKDSGRIVKTRFRYLALLSLVALPLAVVSEGASLYGVAGDRQSTFITVVVTVGLALGGALLIVPLYAGWIRLLGRRSWLR
jgi:hypothetical protein